MLRSRSVENRGETIINSLKCPFKAGTTVYADNFRSSSSMCSLYKYSDDSALADLSNSDSHFEQQVTEVTRWSKDNYLDLNVEKTREMVVDFRRNGCVGELVIEGVIVEKVNEYKYLGTVLDDKLTFESNTNCKKCHQRMFCMFRQRSFGVSPKTLQMVHRNFIESVLTSSFVC